MLLRRRFLKVVTACGWIRLNKVPLQVARTQVEHGTSVPLLSKLIQYFPRSLKVSLIPQYAFGQRHTLQRLRMRTICLTHDAIK